MIDTHPFSENTVNRRQFCKTIVAGTLIASVDALPLSEVVAQQQSPIPKPPTNIADAAKRPRTIASMPGKYPGRVAQVTHSRSVANNKPDLAIVDSMVERSLLALTGAAAIDTAWSEFVTPDDIVGLKVNPVAGKTLSTSLEITQAIIRQLVAAGIQKKNIVIWDRREFELHEVGFTTENFPGIRITGTEQKDAAGSYYDKEGKLYGERMIDRDWFYWADVEEKYDAETIPYMVNEGKHSYFSRICTQDVTKIINIPILKNAGSSITLCLKNLAFGAISNTGRLHKQLWAETCAEVPAFAPLRDKTVLNIVDGIIGCYNGGPGANLQFITQYNTVFAGTDPVAVDRVGYDIILKKRLEMKVQKDESPKGRAFMELAQKLGLGIAEMEKIQWEKNALG
ncbi:MAG: DUF362 domain-containing protein [Ignavibacteriales bacterium]|nr:DUF362 domain-containing protein [Ignavibacteriales bacterium]